MAGKAREDATGRGFPRAVVGAGLKLRGTGTPACPGARTEVSCMKQDVNLYQELGGLRLPSQGAGKSARPTLFR